MKLENWMLLSVDLSWIICQCSRFQKSCTKIKHWKYLSTIDFGTIAWKVRIELIYYCCYWVTGNLCCMWYCKMNMYANIALMCSSVLGQVTINWLMWFIGTACFKLSYNDATHNAHTIAFYYRKNKIGLTLQFNRKLSLNFYFIIYIRSLCSDTNKKSPAHKSQFLWW